MPMPMKVFVQKSVDRDKKVVFKVVNAETHGVLGIFRDKKMALQDIERRENAENTARKLNTEE